jgi:hypothetical protein
VTAPAEYSVETLADLRSPAATDGLGRWESAIAPVRYASATQSVVSQVASPSRDHCHCDTDASAPWTATSGRRDRGSRAAARSPHRCRRLPGKHEVDNRDDRECGARTTLLQSCARSPWKRHLRCRCLAVRRTLSGRAPHSRGASLQRRACERRRRGDRRGSSRIEERVASCDLRLRLVRMFGITQRFPEGRRFAL